MFTRLHLNHFKSFEDAALPMGPFTMLVGTNASGKSNIRDAFRFLHGIGRGYTPAEIIGGAYVGGALQWSGIRGGSLGIGFKGSPQFSLEIGLRVDYGGREVDATYAVGVVAPQVSIPYPWLESLSIPALGIQVLGPNPPPRDDDTDGLLVPIGPSSVGFRAYAPPSLSLALPLVAQHHPHGPAPSPEMELCYHTFNALANMRFIDLDPLAMRGASLPGQDLLTERGENLSGVLHTICTDPQQKRTLLSWIQVLTPMDVVDLDFRQDLEGNVRVELIEGDGRRTSPASASDGTLRYLGLLAAMLGPESQSGAFYFLEEIENGIHPTRLRLLVQLLEKASARGVQVVATTHSPMVLTTLRPESLEHAALTYRLEGRPETKVQRIVDIGDARRVLQNNSAGDLMGAGWLENNMEFLSAEEEDVANEDTGESAS